MMCPKAFKKIVLFHKLTEQDTENTKGQGEKEEGILLMMTKGKGIKKNKMAIEGANITATGNSS